ncbi:MAG: proprotein convertase P-domain-containing protein, partial [Flavobacteriaceae bacterium]
MKKLTFLCALLTVPLLFGQTSLSGNSPIVYNGSAGSTTITAFGNENMNFAPVVITNNLGQTSSGTDIACAGSSVTDNFIWNEYDLDSNFGVTGDFNVTDVEIGIGGVNITTPVPMTVNIYSNNGIFPGGTWTLQGTTIHMLTNADNQSIISIPVMATIPFGENLLYEIFVDGDAGNGVDSMRFMTNTDGFLADSWIQAVDCGISIPTILGLIGPPTSAFIMNVIGDTAAASFTECGVPLGQPIPAAGTSGPMTPSVATVGVVGTVGLDYSIDFVDLDLNHTFDSDLDITLQSPGGLTLDLSSDNGGGADNYTATVFQDGNPNITTGSAPFTGTFEPEGGTLNGTFAGEPVNGDWTLLINDDTGGDVGFLNNYCITFTPIGVIGAPPVIACPADISVDND